MTRPKVALVTGGNRGLGLEVCRQLAGRGLTVLLAARDGAQGRKAAKSLSAAGGAVHALTLDVRSDSHVAAARKAARERFGGVDVLVNNAGVFLDPSPVEESGDNSVFAADAARMLETFDVNALGAFRLCRAFVPDMMARGWGRVVNVSSGDGQLSTMGGGRPAYRVSKTALNALTRVIAAEAAGAGVLVNAVCPGWIKTRMGGPQAKRPVERGAEGVVWAALLPDGGPTGGFFRDMSPFPW